MIVQQSVVFNDRTFIYSYSDEGYYIENENGRYVDALDPENYPRNYVETDIPLTQEEKNTLFITQEVDLFSIV